jgi:virginiamycin B lyase
MPLPRSVWVVNAAIILVSGSGAIDARAAEAAIGSRQQPLSALPIVERVKVPAGPAWLETGFGSVWLSKINSKAVLRIDPATNKVIATIAVGSKPELGIGIGLGFVWIADTHDHSLIQIDPNTNQIVRKIAVNIPKETEGSIGVGEDSIWILTNEGGTESATLSRLDAVSGKIVANIPVKPQSHAALVAFGSVWVTSTGSGSVTRVDPRTNAVTAEIPVHAAPRFMAGGEGSLWVLSQGDGSLARIDPGTNRVTATIDVGVPGEGGDLSIGENYVWVSAERIPLSQIDPRSNRLMRQFAGGHLDDTLRVGFGSAWIVDESHGQIWRVDLEKLAQLPVLSP